MLLIRTLLVEAGIEINVNSISNVWGSGALIWTLLVGVGNINIHKSLSNFKRSGAKCPFFGHYLLEVGIEAKVDRISNVWGPSAPYQDTTCGRRGYVARSVSNVWSA